VQARQDLLDKELDRVKLDVTDIKAELKNVGELARATEVLLKAAEVKIKEAEERAVSTETKLETVVEASLVEGLEKKLELKMSDKVRIAKSDVEEQMEIEKRRGNLVFHGVKETIVKLDSIVEGDLIKSPDQEMIEELLRVGLRLDATRHIEEVQRIGRYQEGKIRPLRVKIKTFEARNEILKRARDLKGLEQFKKVFIAPDLTRKQQEVDKELRDKVKQFREEGHSNVKIKQGKVIKNEEGKQVVVLYQPS
jgi:hypothetical protein